MKLPTTAIVILMSINAFASKNLTNLMNCEDYQQERIAYNNKRIDENLTTVNTLLSRESFDLEVVKLTYEEIIFNAKMAKERIENCTK